ncbi:MAG: hypothetical protein HY799_08100 [Nitrosomonadales bacterium]|nr:hypothetical protein [Nitrosomonadales bacterium]
MDKTVKIPVYNDAARVEETQDRSAKDRDLSFDLAKKEALLEDEKSKSLDLLKTIVQLRESLKQEQVKTTDIVKKAADLEANAKESRMLAEKELARKTAQLEEEKKQSLEFMRNIEQLKESIKHEQAKKTYAADHTAELEARAKEIAALEAKVKDLTATLGKIASIAEAGKMVGGS